MKTYNYALRFPYVFGIKSGNDNVFPAELCWVKPGQRYKRKLSPRDTATFITASMTGPTERLRKIENAVASREVTKYSTRLALWLNLSKDTQLRGFTLDDRCGN